MLVNQMSSYDTIGLMEFFKREKSVPMSELFNQGKIALVVGLREKIVALKKYSTASERLKLFELLYPTARQYVAFHILIKSEVGPEDRERLELVDFDMPEGTIVAYVRELLDEFEEDVRK